MDSIFLHKTMKLQLEEGVGDLIILLKSRMSTLNFFVSNKSGILLHQWFIFTSAIHQTRFSTEPGHVDPTYLGAAHGSIFFSKSFSRLFRRKICLALWQILFEWKSLLRDLSWKSFTLFRDQLSHEVQEVLQEGTKVWEVVLVLSKAVMKQRRKVKKYSTLLRNPLV